MAPGPSQYLASTQLGERLPAVGQGLHPHLAGSVVELPHQPLANHRCDADGPSVRGSECLPAQGPGVPQTPQRPGPARRIRRRSRVAPPLGAKSLLSFRGCGRCFCRGHGSSPLDPPILGHAVPGGRRRHRPAQGHLAGPLPVRCLCRDDDWRAGRLVVRPLGHAPAARRGFRDEGSRGGFCWACCW